MRDRRVQAKSTPCGSLQQNEELSAQGSTRERRSGDKQCCENHRHNFVVERQLLARVRDLVQRQDHEQCDETDQGERSESTHQRDVREKLYHLAIVGTKAIDVSNMRVTLPTCSVNVGRRRSLAADFHQGNPVHTAAGEDEAAVMCRHHVTHDTAS